MAAVERESGIIVVARRFRAVSRQGGRPQPRAAGRPGPGRIPGGVMTASIRPRRSVLYMLGSNPRALEKARSLAADGLILDLEDAVAPDAKEAARTLVLDALAQGGYGNRELLIRVNGPASVWGCDDLIAAARSGAQGV